MPIKILLSFLCIIHCGFFEWCIFFNGSELLPFDSALFTMARSIARNQAQSELEQMHSWAKEQNILTESGEYSEQVGNTGMFVTEGSWFRHIKRNGFIDYLLKFHNERSNAGKRLAAMEFLNFPDFANHHPLRASEIRFLSLRKKL